MKTLLKYTILLSLLITAQDLFAQYEDLQKNDDIIWIAEFSNDYSFALNADEAEQAIKLIKYNEEASDLSNANKSHWVKNWVIDAVVEGKSKCYKDPELKEALSKDELASLLIIEDKFITFDPGTYEEQVRTVQTELSGKGVWKLRIHQVIYYDKSNKRFETRIISVAPIIQIDNGYSKTTKTKLYKTNPLFWIKMDGKLPKKFNPNSSDINWAALVLDKKNPIEIEEIKATKINEGFNFQQRIYKQVFKSEKPITDKYGDRKQLSIDNLNAMYLTIDTVITFHPETYEEKVQIVTNELKPENIKRVKLVQEWYYDKKRKVLMNRLKAISPAIEGYDKRGRFSHWKSMYFIGSD